MCNPLKRRRDAMATPCECYIKQPSGCWGPNSSPAPWLQLPKRKVISEPSDVLTQQHRAVVLDDLQETVYQADWQWFQQAVLPSPRMNLDMPAIIADLKKKGTLTTVQGEHRWSDFATCAPTLCADKEDAVFCVLPKIFASIRAASKYRSRWETKFLCAPREVPISATRDSNSMPDGYFLMNDADAKHPRWIDVATPAEFKKSDTVETRSQNASQILWSLTHILREDARRRFVIGFTIENTHMRLWVANRSDVLVSLPINFVTDVEKVIDFVVRISSARTDELGFDDSIVWRNKLTNDASPQYDIRVDKKWYRTQRLISNIGAEAILGRGTRVWEVRELDKKGGTEVGPALVLKDSWVDASRDREAVILKNIRRSAKNDIHRAVFDNYLLQVKEHSGSWDVCSGRRRRVDNTRLTLFRRPLPTHLPAMAVKKYPKEDQTVNAENPPRGGTPGVMKEISERRRFHAKVHHRVIFTQVGKTVMEAETLDNAFSALSDIVTVLKVMHQCGWVHRDVSAGNVLVVDGQGILADVEYAKHQSDHRTHEIKTGTAFFMAVEVDLHKYLHARAVKNSEVARTEENAEGVDERTERKLAMRKAKKTQAQSQSQATASHPQQLAELPKIGTMPFRHNPLHDLESLLWLAFYIVLCSIMEKWDSRVSDEQWASYALSRRTLAAKLFNDLLFRHWLVSGGVLDPELKQLHPTLHVICDKVKQCLEDLSDLYLSAEQRQIQAALHRARQLTHSGAAISKEIIPEPIPYDEALNARLYTKIEDAFDALAEEDQYWADHQHSIAFKPRTTLLSDQQREMITLLQAASGKAPLPTIAEEAGAEADDERPAKRNRPSAFEVEDLGNMMRRSKLQRHAMINRETVSANTAYDWM
ncbi:hypothetical protein PsYK624_135920 [Phanerochaete sordida]|uniref:Fungal-type protein kinase domain-containing protein n=1 Tax=Phanerochaete sordida TaxID=48140 RepID=A0A9P3LJB6_9APHY|nr:hypothetical protein PsYK624_135920 [Phanerochaete sordida]